MYLNILINIRAFSLATDSSNRGCATSIDELRAGIVNKLQPHDLTYVIKRLTDFNNITPITNAFQYRTLEIKLISILYWNLKDFNNAWNCSISDALGIMNLRLSLGAVR